MPKYKSDPLFDLILSLSKAEKRNFKLHVGKSSFLENAKFMQLFDYLCKQKELNEAHLLKSLPEIKPSQLSNQKAHLYQYILASLRDLQKDDIDMQIRKLVDYSNLLYNRALYYDSRRILEKAKKLAIKNKRNTFLLAIADIDKLLITKIIRYNIENQVEEAISQSKDTIQRINNTNRFKDLSLILYAKYLKMGFIRNKEDFDEITKFYESNLPEYNLEELGIEEKHYLYKAKTSYYFFIQDFEKAYEYSKKWVLIFQSDDWIPLAKTEEYLKAISNLTVAQTKLKKHKQLENAIRLFDEIEQLDQSVLTPNIRFLIFKNRTTAIINKYLANTEFEEGVNIIPELADEMEELSTYMDSHWEIIFYYKFACMYIGANDYNTALDWLNKILNYKDLDIRNDVLLFTRILNIICHWELGNDQLMEYHIRSTYRFFHKKGDFNQYQKSMIRFFRRLGSIVRTDLKDAFIELKGEMETLTKDPIERRAFIYFDMISWLESKLENIPVAEVMRRKL